MNVSKSVVSELFSPDQSLKFVIPKYQREYSWGKDEWQDLIDDILEDEGGHFIGSLIGINRDSDSLNPDLEIVDGQQRLSTISLMFSAIYSILKDSPEIQDNEDLKTDLNNLKYRIIQKNRRGEIKIEMSSQNYNSDDYKAILADLNLINFSTEIRNRGNRIIMKAFRFFQDSFRLIAVGELMDFYKKLSSVVLVKIEVSSNSDAFMLFESLNNRGVPLSAIDLIKNKMLSKLENKGRNIDETYEQWKIIISNLPEMNVQERFLRHYYNAFKEINNIKMKNISKATKSNIIKIYEELIDKDAENIFNELINKSDVYKQLVYPESNGNNNNLNKVLTDLINVKAAPAYSFLMFLSVKRENSEEINELMIEVSELLVKYFIRRNLTDFPNTRNLDKIFIDLIELVGSKKENYNIDFISNYLLKNNERVSNISDFEQKLRGNVYDLNVDATRFILSKIEEKKRFSKEVYSDFWERDNSNKLLWTVEHILPEGKNIPSAWIKMIADGDKEMAQGLQEKYVHKLGNLTLTGYNQNLSNMDFIAKRDRKKDGKFIGYKNGLYLNEELKDLKEWNIKRINDRSDKLVKDALEIFKFGSE